MTTKFLDNKICTFKILLSWRFPRKKKQRLFLGTIFPPPFPPFPPSQKHKIYIFYFKNLLMPLFLMGCFPVDLQERKRPIKAFKETAH